MISDLEKTEAGGQATAGGQKALVTVPVISLWQPWAQWVVIGWKTIETRTHPRFETLAGKRIGIHAAQKWDKNAIHIARPYLTDDQFHQTLEMFRTHHCDSGKILGTVFAKEHRLLDPDDAPAALIECATERFGLIFRDPLKLDPPIAVKGRQAIFHAEVPNAE
jgi:hypothetical protein